MLSLVFMMMRVFDSAKVRISEQRAKKKKKFFSFFWLFRAGVPIYKARKSSKRGKLFCQENSESKWVRSRVFQSNRSFARKYAENERFPQVVDIHSLNLRRAVFTSLKVAVRVAICGILVRNIRHITPQFASFDMLRDHL